MDNRPPVAMKALEYLTYVGKLAGFVSALNVIPFVDPAVRVLMSAAASLLKDTVYRIGDLLNDGCRTRALTHPTARAASPATRLPRPPV